MHKNIADRNRYHLWFLWIIALMLSLPLNGQSQLPTLTDTVSPVSTAQDSPVVQVMVSADPVMWISPGAVLDLIIRAEGEGGTRLYLRADSLPGFAGSWTDQTSGFVQGDAGVEAILSFHPQEADGGTYTVLFTAEVEHASGTVTDTLRQTIIVSSQILPEPPYTANTYNEIRWIPIQAFSEVLSVSAAGKFPQQDPSTAGFSSTDTVSQIVEDLQHGKRYQYYIRSTLKSGDMVASDTVYSTQDNDFPGTVTLSETDFDLNGMVILRWNLQDGDEGSFVDRFQVLRKRASEGEFTPIDTIPARFAMDLEPQSAYPDFIQAGEPYYPDRPDITLESVPAELQHAAWIRQEYDQRWNMKDQALSWISKDSVRVYIAFDANAESLPQWMQSYGDAGANITFTNLSRELKLYSRDYGPGRISLGGNYAGGAEFPALDPMMYAVLVEPLSPEVQQFRFGEYFYRDASLIDPNGKRYVYKVRAVDAAGNVGEGIPSGELLIDLTPPCIPEFEDWFVFQDPLTGQKYGRDMANQLCIIDPADLQLCDGLATVDSIQFQVARDSARYFTPEDDVDRTGLFFDSGWVPDYCYTVDFVEYLQQVSLADSNFVNGHNYLYRVRAKDIHGNMSSWSDTVSAIQDVFPPGDVSNFTGITSGPVIQLRWDEAFDAASGVDSYQLYRNSTPIGETDGTAFEDSISHLQMPGEYLYRIGSTDRVGHVRSPFASSRKVVVRKPGIHPDSATAKFVLPDTITTARDTVNIVIETTGPGVLEQTVYITGPHGLDSTVTTHISDTMTVNLPGGNGVYQVSVKQRYTDALSIPSNALIFNKFQGTVSPPEDLAAENESKAPGDIRLSWTHPDSEEIDVYHVFTWWDGQQQPEEPIATVSDTSWTYAAGVGKLKKIAYQCYRFRVKAEDIHGNLSPGSPAVAEYASTPPRIIQDSVQTDAGKLRICWERPAPLPNLGAENYDAIVEIYSGHISDSTRIDSTRVYDNPSCYSLYSQLKPQTYVIRVKEILIGEQEFQFCSDHYESAWSVPYYFPYENIPEAVTSLAIQPLPIPPDEETGSVLLSWEEYNDPSVESYLVEVWRSDIESEGISKRIQVKTDSIGGLAADGVWHFTVAALDTLGQRSVDNDTLQLRFEPRWMFTPEVSELTPKFFRDSITVHWDWINASGNPVGNIYGAEMVQTEISIDPEFGDYRTRSGWVPASNGAYTFHQDQSDYPFVNSQNNVLYARVRAREAEGNLSPWSSEYPELHSGDGGPVRAEYDVVPPAVIGCNVDSVKAPRFNSGHVVNVILEWNPSEDEQSGVHRYEIVRNDTTVVGVVLSAEKRFRFTDRNLAGDSSLLDHRWTVHAIDSANNRQPEGIAAQVPNLIQPPETGRFTPPNRLSWEESETVFPVEEIRYRVQVTNDSILFGIPGGAYEASAWLDTASYSFRRQHEPLYWRVKARAGELESPWSGIFDNYTLPVSNKKFLVTQNYPNPFNPTTVIYYTVPENRSAGMAVRIDIYDLRGRRVKTLVDGYKTSGVYSVTWNGTNETGKVCASGVYYYRIHAGTNVVTRKMLFLR